MESELIKAEQQLEDQYWWFIGKRIFLDRALRYFVGHSPLAIDIGCGSGRNMQVLARHSSSRFPLV